MCRKQIYGYQQGKGGGINWEVEIDIYTLRYIKLHVCVQVCMSDRCEYKCVVVCVYIVCVYVWYVCVCGMHVGTSICA